MTNSAAPAVTSSQATLSGSVNPNGSDTTYFFQWGFTPAYGTVVQGTPLGAQTTPIDVSAALSGLSPSTTYHYQLVASNSLGIASTLDLSFSTMMPQAPSPPTVGTGAATDITTTSASLSGSVNPNGLPTLFHFELGRTSNYGTTLLAGSVGGQTSAFDVTSGQDGLSPNTTYHYQLVASNSVGISYGGDQTFTTLPIVTGDATNFLFSCNNGAVTIVGYTGPGGSVTIPSTVGGLPVTSIGDYAFPSASSPGLTNVIIPEGVTNIGNSAFYGCANLEHAAVPNTVVSIGMMAFGGCGSLTNFTIPDGVTTIADDTFEWCTNLASVIFGKGVTSIGKMAFDHCTSLTSMAIPDSVANIKDGAVEWVPQGAFTFCTGLTNVTIGNSVTNIGDYAFYGCSNLMSATLGQSVAVIGVAAFDACDLTKIAIPDNVANIKGGGIWPSAMGAFAYCTNLTTVTIGTGIANIGDLAFQDCANLTGLFFRGNAPAVSDTAFQADTLLTVYYLPGTTGWGPSFGGSPTALWNPEIQTAGPGFGAHPQGFGFGISGNPDIPLVIEASTDLSAKSWTRVQSCTLTNGSIYFMDPQPIRPPARFYRIRTP